VIVVYVDGLCEPVNPGGVACYGYVVYRDGERVAEGCGVADHPSPSNNVAEYWACIKALERLAEMGLGRGEEVVVRSDSQLLVRQLSGRYAVRAPRIRPLFERASSLAKSLGRVRFEWVPREENEEADRLSRVAYERHASENLEEFLKRYGRYLATERQRALLERLGLPCPPWTPKREASRLIEGALSGGRSRRGTGRGRRTARPFPY